MKCDTILNLFSLLSLLSYYVPKGVLSEVDENSFMSRCSLYIDEKNECVHCHVLLSTRELFYDQLHSETYYDVFCQPQVDATYVNVVTIHSSDPSVKYLVLSLESDRSNIHQTREVLFYINYFSSSSNQNVDHYFVAKLQVSGSDREQLPKMRIALPLGDADLYKKVQVLSHSRLACGGLSSSIEIHSNGIADTVTFEPKEAKLNDNKTCKYLQKYLPLVPEKSQRHEPPIKQIPPVKPLVIREKGQKQKPSDQSLTARLDEETPSMTVIVDKSLFIAYAFIVLAASLLLIAFAVLVKTGRVERRNWEKMRQCFCWTGNRRPSNAEIQQLPLRQVQEPRLNGDANGNQQVPLYAIRPDDRGPPPASIAFGDYFHGSEVGPNASNVEAGNEHEQILEEADSL